MGLGIDVLYVLICLITLPWSHKLYSGKWVDGWECWIEKEVAMACSEVLSHNLWGAMQEKYKNFWHDFWPWGHESNRRAPKYEAGEIITQHNVI